MSRRRQPFVRRGLSCAICPFGSFGTLSVGGLGSRSGLTRGGGAICCVRIRPSLRVHIVDSVTCFAVRAVALIQRSRNGAANVVRADVGVLDLILVCHTLPGIREPGNQELRSKKATVRN